MNQSHNRGITLPFLCILALGILGAVAPPTAVSQQKRIYIANDDHTDYVWTANEADYRLAFLEMLDYYLDQADATDTLAGDFQGRFNADGNFWMWTYEKNRSAAQFDRLISRIRDGHITVPLQTLVLCYGAMPAEAVLRSMYYAGRVERARDLRFELVSAMENQTFPYGLPSLWAGAGAKYSWKGVCGCASQVPNLGNRGREIYNAVGPDGRSVLMKWHSLEDGSHNGGYAEARDPVYAVNFASSNATFLGRYPFDRVVGMFGKGQDDFTTFTDAMITTAQAMSNPSRRVIVSNEVDFFQDFSATAPPDSIPDYSGGFGNEWELYCATMAEVTASVKRSVEELRTAEALATYVARINPSFMNSRKAAADSAFQNMGLFYEHDWTADGPSSPQRPAFQRRLASQIAGYVGGLKIDASTALAGYIQSPGGNRFYVFSPLGWVRTDVADVAGVGSGPFRVIDVTGGNEVRCQRITRNAQQFIRILAENVPSLGYRVYEIQPVASQFSDSAAAFSSGNATFENDKYRVTVNGRGAISGLIDKRDGDREWVQSLGGQLINDLGSGSGTPAAENVGPVSATIFVNAGGSPQHRTRITLYRTVDRIDIENEITSNFGDAVTTYSFGFNLSNYTVRHEEIGAVATAKTVSQGGSYSDDHGRYDYLTMNHFVDLSDAQRGMTLSNWESPFFKLGNSSGTTIDGSTPRVRALAGGRIDANLGVSNQNGDSYFRNRYALRRHGPYNQALAMRMAMEHQNPFSTAMLTGTPSGPYPGSSYSLAAIADSNVLLWAFKPAEEGIAEGIIARVWNLAPSTSSFQLSLDQPLVGAYRTSHIETNTGIASVTGGALAASLAGQQMQTFRLLTSGSMPNMPPAVTLTSPSNGASFTAPAGISLAAAAADSDGSVACVIFSSDSTVIGVDSTAPYTALWDSVTAGIYQLSATAVDNLGSSGVSQSVSVIVTGGMVTIDVPVSQSWNLLSLPLARDNGAVPVVFPTATSWWAYEPGVGYSVFDTLRQGSGYWMRFPFAAVVTLAGDPVGKDTIPVLQGWNLLGSISIPVPVSALVAAPDGIIGSLFYRFSDGYHAADTLLPGYGYWVRLNGAGEVILDPGAAPANGRPGISAVALAREYNAITITDAAGRSQTLYYRVGNPDTGQSRFFAMPPSGPGSIFDARFASGMLAEILDPAGLRVVPVKVSFASFPVTISWDVRGSDQSAVLTVGATDVRMEGGGTKVVTDPDASILVRGPGVHLIPAVYALDHNYPNPFNPRTTLRYSLPVTSTVRMVVYDLLGQRVATLVDGRQEAGFQTAEWNAQNAQGQPVASGVYLLRFEARSVDDPSAGFTQIQKMVFVR